MKIRNGFVSNSSSSSFVVAAKDGNTKVKISIEIDLKDYLSRYTKPNPIRTVEALEKFYLDNYGDDSIEEMKENSSGAYEEFEKCKAEIESGRVIYVGSFSSEGEGIEAALCSMGLENVESADMTVISGYGGY